jgi:excinuclease ABC subunit B
LNGEVILYADIKTQSIQKFLAVSEYRRQKQVAYNQEHNITPRSVTRAVEESLSSYTQTSRQAQSFLAETGVDIDLSETIKELEGEMLSAANNLEFEKAALLRDQIRELKRAMDGSQAVKGAKGGEVKPVNYGRSGKRRSPSHRQVPF